MKKSDDLVVLSSILDRMVSDNVTISARSVVRQADSPYKHASDLTRNPDRRRILEAAVSRQRQVRALAQRCSGSSRIALESRVARLAMDNQALKAERDLLIHSHRAMLLAVGELGGMAAWRRYFSEWNSVRDKLVALSAMPDADVKSMEDSSARVKRLER